ncbi:hypothetical protein AGMMS50222_07370 [Endomicrobiia bacterium]|nr:hypothetical protein AGMMS50222_07370 [Endomicrobiia bacterium]
MWEEIKIKLQEKLSEEDHSLWLDPIKEESLKNHTLTLIIPNKIYLEQMETKYKPHITNTIKENFNKNIKICFKIIEEDIPNVKQRIEKTKTYQQQRKELTTFDKSPNFRSQEEMDLYLKKPEIKLQKDLAVTQLKPMPGRYGTTMAASFTSFDSRYFTYPNDKRKSSKVDIKIKYANGKYTQYELYRGLNAFGMPAVGQLNTTHARILLALVHMWQKQGCLFAGIRDFAVVEISIRELAKDLDYKKISGALYKWLYLRIGELISFPSLLSLDGNTGRGFTFLSSVDAWSNKKDYNKTMLRLTFNPFISRQLYDRRAFLKNPECYKIKNPIAFKFLMSYDRSIFKGNKLKLPFREVIKTLQIDYKRIDVTVKALKRAIKELNKYEINEHYNLKVDLIKENKQYFVTARAYFKK